MRIAVVDTETTGTDPRRHQLWEFAAVIVPEPDEDGRRSGALEPVWFQAPVDLTLAEPLALGIGRYWERYSDRTRRDLPDDGWLHPDGRGPKLARALAGTAFASCNVTFDAAFVSRWLRDNGAVPSWHYSPIDVKSVAYGAKPGLIGAKTSDLLDAFAVDVDQCLAYFDLTDEGRHSALGDAYLATALLYEVCGWGTVYGSRCNDHYGGYRCRLPFRHEHAHRDRDQAWARDADGSILRTSPDPVA